MSALVITPTFRGVVAASLTPFAGDGRLDLAAVPPLVDFLLHGGVAGLMVGGSTGEFIAMSSDERIATITAFLAAAEGRVPVIAHIAHPNVAEAHALAHRAAGAGANALTALVPYYHRTSPGAIQKTLRELAQAVPELPFFVYNYPDAAGNALAFSTFTDLLDEPNLAGVKLSVGTVAEIEPYTAVLDRVSVLSGNDTLMPEVVGLGGTAVVSGNAAAFPDVVTAVLRGLLDGDEETATAAPQLLSSLATLSRAGAPDRLRALLARRGIDTGRSRIRTYLPQEVDGAEEERLLGEVLSAARRATA
jgi:dihydrodipicolinate synthase/N-acetylneuraminate lyase